MIWFFEKDGEHLQCEIRPAADGPGFELVWAQGGGDTQVERFASADDAERHRVNLESTLRERGWKPVGGASSHRFL